MTAQPVDPAAAPRKKRFAPALTPAFVWHLVRHNLASLRPFLGAWAAVLVVQSLVLWMGPPVPDGTTGPPMSLDIAALVMRLALTVVFVSALVQRHPVVGTTAFWRTRPMPQADVFASTVATLGLVTVLFPYAWSAVTFWGLGFDPAHAAKAAVPMAIEQVSFTAVALLLAALTRNLAQAVVAVLVVAIAAVLGRQALRVLPYLPLSFGLVVRQSEWSAALPMLTGSAALILLAAHQYLTLKTRRSFVFVAAVAVAMLLNTRFPFIRMAPARVIPPADVTLETPPVYFDRGSVRSETVSRLAPSGHSVDVSLSVLLEVPGTAGAIVLRPLAVQSRLTFRDDGVERFDSQMGVPWVDRRPEASVSRQPWRSLSLALGGAGVLGTREEYAERFRVTFLELEPDTYARRSNEPARLDINVTAEAYRYDALARLALTPGARAYAPGHVLAFEGTAPAEHGVAVLVREMATPAQFNPPPTFYALLNAGRKEAVLATNTFTERFRSVLTYDASPGVSRHRFEFVVDPSFSPQRLALDAEWLAGAELVVLKPTSLGRVIRGLREEGFTLAPAQ